MPQIPARLGVIGAGDPVADLIDNTGSSADETIENVAALQNDPALLADGVARAEANDRLGALERNIADLVRAYNNLANELRRNGVLRT